MFAIASFIVAVTVATIFKEYGKINGLKAALDDRVAILVDQMRKNQEIQDKISYYNTPSGIAHLAREEFNLVKPGEKMYKLEIIAQDKK